MNLKNGKVFSSKFVGTGPSSYKKRIYRAAVSQVEKHWCSLLLLGYKPVQHVTVLNTVGNCNTTVSITILYHNTML
jgi:Uri superfamily endonuclease